jgi:hypothetical protein
MRRLAIGAALVAILVPVVSSAGPAAAGTPLKPAIACDAATNTISTSVSGGTLMPNQAVRVAFRVQYGSYVTTSGSQGVIPQSGSTTTVPAVTAADGSVRATGYSRAWPASSYVFYTETVYVSITNPAGVLLVAGSATCTRDLRTTVTLACDQQAHTITARTSGIGYTQPSRVRIEYAYTSTSQATADSPRFTRQNLQPPDFVHYAMPSGGTWSDIGYVHTIAGDPYYLAETVLVTVRGDWSIVIGRGETSCVYADQSVG